MNILKFKRRIVKYPITVILLIFSLFTTSFAEIGDIYSVVGNSMSPTLKDGDMVQITSKEYADGDMVIATPKNNEDFSVIKRIQGNQLIGDNLTNSINFMLKDMNIIGKAEKSGDISSNNVKTALASDFQWKTITGLPKNMAFTAITLMNDGRVFAAGGGAWTGDSTTSAQLRRQSWIYDPITDEWERAADLPKDLCDALITTMSDGRLFLTGGNQHSVSSPASYNTSSYIYNPSNNTWTSAASLNNSYRGLMNSSIGLLPNGRILITGGIYEGSQYTQDGLIYNPTNNTWTTLSLLLSYPRGGHTHIVLPDETILLGGGTDGSKTYITAESMNIYRFNTATNTLSEYSIMDAVRFGGNYGFTPFSENKVVAVRRNINTNKGETRLWDVVSNTWSDGPENQAFANFGTLRLRGVKLKDDSAFYLGESAIYMLTPNKPPTINITHPTNMQYFHNRSNIPIVYTGSDPNGDTITYNVRMGTTPGGIDIHNGPANNHFSSAYGEHICNLSNVSLIWNSAGYFERTIYAQVTGSDGSLTDTKNISFVIYNHPPVIEISTPTVTNYRGLNDTFTLSGKAWDPNGGRIEIRATIGGKTVTQVIEASPTARPAVDNFTLTFSGTNALGIGEYTNITATVQDTSLHQGQATWNGTIIVKDTLKAVLEGISNSVISNNSMKNFFIVDTNTKASTTNPVANNQNIKTILNQQNSDIFYIGTLDADTSNYVRPNLMNDYKGVEDNYAADQGNTITNGTITKIVNYIKERMNNIPSTSSNILIIPNTNTGSMPSIEKYKKDFNDPEFDFEGITMADKIEGSAIMAISEAQRTAYQKTRWEQLKSKKIEKVNSLKGAYKHYPNILEYSSALHAKNTDNLYNTALWKQIGATWDASDNAFLLQNHLSVPNFLINQVNETMRGKWELYLTAEDNTGRSGYDKSTGIGSPYVFYVHRQPTAIAEITGDNASQWTLTAGSSYDIDYFSKGTRGIKNFTWEVVLADGTRQIYLNGSNQINVTIPKTISTKAVKNIILTVEDFGVIENNVELGGTAKDSVDMNMGGTPYSLLMLPTAPIFIGRLGSDTLTTSHLSIPESKVTNTRWTFTSMTSTNNQLKTGNTIFGSFATDNPRYNKNDLKTRTFTKNTLRLDNTNTVTSFSRAVNVEVEFDNNYAGRHIKNGNVTFTPVVIQSITTVSTAKEGQKVNIKSNIANSTDSYHNTFADIKIYITGNGQPKTLVETLPTQKMNYIGSGNWESNVTIPAVSKTGYNRPMRIEAEVNVRIENASDSTIVYDNTATAPGGIVPNPRTPGVVIQILTEPQTDFEILTKEWKTASPREHMRSDAAYSHGHYLYVGEKLYLKSTQPQTNLGTAITRAWTYGNEFLGTSIEVIKDSLVASSTMPYTASLKVTETIGGQTAETSKAKTIGIIPVSITGMDRQVFMGEEITLQANVDGVRYDTDVSVYAKIDYKTVANITLSDTIQLTKINGTYEKKYTVPFELSGQKLQNAIVNIEYVVESTRSGEANKSMHVLARDMKKFTVLKTIIESKDYTVYATYDEIIEVKLVNVRDSWKVDIAIPDFLPQTAMTKVSEGKFTYNYTGPIVKDSSGYNINNMEKAIVFTVKDQEGNVISTDFINETRPDSKEFKIKIITPNIASIDTTEFVSASEYVVLDATTSHTADKYFMVASINGTEHRLNANANRFTKTIDPLSNLAGEYPITYSLYSLRTNQLVDEKNKPIKVDYALFNPRIIDSATGLQTTMIVPDRGYDYYIDSTLNVNGVNLRYNNEISTTKVMTLHKVHVDKLTWTANITSVETLAIAKVKNDIRTKASDKDSDPNVLILADNASFTATAVNGSPLLENLVEDVKVSINATVGHMQKRINNVISNLAALDTIPASERLILKDVVIKTNVEASSAVVRIPVQYYQAATKTFTASTLQRIITLPVPTSTDAGAERIYEYTVPTVNIDIPANTRDSIYVMNIRVTAKNGSYNDVPIGNVEIKTPINLLGYINNKTNSAIVFLDDNNELKANSSKYTNTLRVEILETDMSMVETTNIEGIKTWLKTIFVDSLIGEISSIARYTATTPNGNTEVFPVNFTTVLPLAIIGEITPNPALAGERVQIVCQTEGYGENVEIVMWNGDTVVLESDIPITNKNNTWRGSYIVPINTPDGTYMNKATVTRGPKTATADLPLIIKGNIYQLVRPRIRNTN